MGWMGKIDEALAQLRELTETLRELVAELKASREKV